MKALRVLFILFAWTIFGTMSAEAATRAIRVEPEAIQNAQQRLVALVIGNSGYLSQPLLPNPRQDAQNIARVLGERGFELVGGGPQFDLDKGALETAIRSFGQMSAGAATAVLYYSGHGVSIGGVNYLIPIEAKMSHPADAPFELVSADLLLTQFRGGMNMLFLDACRNNPFLQTGNREIPRGLASMRAPRGMIIGFSTEPGDVAADGPSGGMSPYTNAFVGLIDTPGLDIFAFLNDVGNAVVEATAGDQQPWMNASPIQGRFFFTPPTTAPGASAPEPPTPQNLATPANINAVSTGADLGFIQQARDYLSIRDFANTHRVLAQAKLVEPRSALGYSFEGFTFYLEGNEAMRRGSREAQGTASMAYSRAAAELERAVQLDPQYQPARRHLGNVRVAVFLLFGSRDVLQQAVGDLIEATQLDSTSRTAHTSLGFAYLHAGQYERAFDPFRTAVDLDETRGRKLASPYAGLCTAYAMTGNERRARANAEAAAGRAAIYGDYACLRQIVRVE